MKLSIEGMTCGHCVKSVTEALAKVPGVEKVIEVSLERKQAEVSGNPQAAQLIHAVQDAGFEARML